MEERKCVPTPIGDLLEKILEELRISNARSFELEKRMNRLELKDEVYSVNEAAAYLGRSRQTISRYIRIGMFHLVEKGGKRGILLSELNKTFDI